MAWFSTSSKPPNETAAPSTDGAYIAPDRSTRAKCYEARDRFFDCLEQNGIIDSIREKEKAGKACATEEKGMAMTCAASWVTYFKQQRVVEHRKRTQLQQLEKEGAQRIEQDLPMNLPRGKS